MNASNDERREYIFQLTNGNECIDASGELCSCHPQQLTFGRHINCEHKGTKCNLFSKKRVMNGVEYVLFVTSRRIDAFEELRYAYGGCTPRTFQASPSSDVTQSQSSSDTTESDANGRHSTSEITQLQADVTMSQSSSDTKPKHIMNYEQFRCSFPML